MTTYRNKFPEPLYSIPPKQRTCLKCLAEFESLQGARICPTCTEKNKTVAKRVDASGCGTHSRKGVKDSL